MSNQFQPGWDAPPPDDSEWDEVISESETLTEALFYIISKYDAPVTNNYPGWRDGVYYRHIGDFVGEIVEASKKFPLDT